MTRSRQPRPCLPLTSSAQGTGRQSFSLQHSLGYQECAPAAFASNGAKTTKQANFFILILKSLTISVAKIDRYRSSKRTTCPA
jgi:hypothetical protein